VLVIILLVIVDKTGGLPAQMIARVTTYATVGTYIPYLMVTVGASIARSKGWPKGNAYFNLGKWGWPVNIAAIVYGVLMIFNLAWPRPTVGVAWYDKWNAWLSVVVVFVNGFIVYLIQRARGIDISATIHEIDESPEEAEAALAMTAGESGKVITPDSE
jgi:amino acid transporter